ncbi:DUF1622 domain-containing protein [Flagellimonas onchidii]|uniref:DUF1622 domain-containing protein n=1 Tax=Flagellimonas onchidii TaxID=2562684 RepID=UPI0010A6326E|nr:DUF1622 domain-containing protein [Allomuricauda onchidii]
MEHIKEGLSVLSEIVSYIGVVILMYGFAKGLIQLVKTETTLKRKDDFFKATQNVRSKIGLYILLALDFLIAADIIDSVIHRNIDELTKLGIVIVIRIAIGYFLGKEITEIHSSAEKEQTNV